MLGSSEDLFTCSLLHLGWDEWSSGRMMVHLIHCLLGFSGLGFFTAWRAYSQILSEQMAFLIAQLIKNLPAMQEIPVQFLDWEGPLEKQ